MARARNTDPRTSHEAAKEAEASGRAATHRAICLEEVKKSPGRTAAKIAKATGLERHVPSRRLPELRDAGLVENREVRRCGVWRVGGDVLGIAQKDNEEAVARLQQCRRTDRWPTGYEEIRVFDWL